MCTPHYTFTMNITSCYFRPPQCSRPMTALCKMDDSPVTIHVGGTCFHSSMQNWRLGCSVEVAFASHPTISRSSRSAFSPLHMCSQIPAQCLACMEGSANRLSSTMLDRVMQHGRVSFRQCYGAVASRTSISVVRRSTGCVCGDGDVCVCRLCWLCTDAQSE
jgi:hypothetical protein